MPIRPRASAPAVPTRSHVGFGWDGSLIMSAVRVDNPPTRLVERLVRMTVQSFLSPADVVQLVALEGPGLQRVMGLECVARWSELDRFHLWPLAPSGKPSEEVIRCMGKGRPLWLDDPNAWGAMVAEAERFREERPCHEYVRYKGTDHPVRPGEKYSDAVFRVAGNVLGGNLVAGGR